jgi:uncharacterized protein
VVIDRLDRPTEWKISTERQDAMAVSPAFFGLLAIGFVAQLIDGCVGMGYGICSSALLATLGIPPAVTSATVHAAEFVTAGVSGVAHAWFRNIDRRIFGSLVLPGVLGGIVGASLLTHVPTHVIRPFVWGYLLIMSLVVLTRVILQRAPIAIQSHGPGLGAVAGFLDAIGGGGWGAIVTSTLIARGVPSRYAIGTANTAVFFVAFATSVTLWWQLGSMRYDLILGLLLGGAAAAPIAACLTRHMPHRVAAIVVGLLVFALGVNGLFRTLT